MAFTNIFNAGCGFLFWMVAARHYSIGDVGLATALISSLGLVILFSRLGFDYSIIRFFSMNDKSKIFATSLIITTVASFMMGGIFILLAEYISTSLAFLKEPNYSIIFLLIIIMNSVDAVIGISFIADRRADYCLIQSLIKAIRIPLLIPLALLGAFGIFGSIGLALFVASLIGLVVLKNLFVTIKPEIEFDFVQRSFRFSSMNYIANIFVMAPSFIFPLMILKMLGEADAAMYYIAYTIGKFVEIIPNSLGTSLFVEGSHGKGLKKSVVQATWGSLALLIPAVIMIFLFGDRLLGFIHGEYVGAFDLLKLLALSSVLMVAETIFVPIQNVRMKMESIVKLNMAKCFLLLVLSYVFVNWYGLIGVGYGWILTSGIVTIWIGWIVYKEHWV